ncbi:MAG TPA: tetratricopeptide repeat protein [Verrucomicrobiae bacterium]
MAKRRTPSPTTNAVPRPSDALGAARLRRPWVVCLLLALATFLAYSIVARHGFVDYDDGDYVSANPHVENGLTWANVAWAFTTGHASNWHPLTWLSHMLDYQLFGRNPGAMHLVNLAIHIANTLLLFLVLRRMTGAHWRSAMVAALFALHPLHVESVAWLSERKDVLSGLFFMLTLWAYGHYAELRTPKPEIQGRSAAAPPVQRFNPSTRQRVWYSLSLVAFALGLISKPMLVTVPFLLLLLDYWPLDRAQGAGDGAQATAGLGFWLRRFVEKLPFFALAVASSAATFIVQRKGGAVSTALTIGQRSSNAIVSYVRYLWKMLWPENLAVLYPHPGDWPIWQVIGSAVLLAAIFALVIWQARTRRYVAVGWLWFAGMLVPVIGLVQVGIQSMADRYTYVPLIGIFIIVAWGVWDLAQRWAWRKEALASAACLSLFTCGLLTMRQAEFWRDSETLFRRAVEVEPKNYLAYNNLGFYFANHGRPAEALENYRKSIENNPNYEDALNNMGHALAQQQRHAEAIPYYEAALRVRPLHVEVHNNLGNGLSELGKIDEAIAHYRIALEQKPDHADAHNNLGIALAMKGKLDEALPHFREAIRLRPNYASAHSNLGNALAAQQKWDDAIKEYRECLRLNPDDPQAYNNLGNVLSQLGKLDEAVQNYSQAIRLKANNPEAQFNLGMALNRQGKREEARTHFEAALRLKPDYVEAERQLRALGATPK